MSSRSRDRFNNMAAQLGRQFHTLALRRDIAALRSAQSLEDFLQASADALVRHLGLPMVGIWLSEAIRRPLSCGPRTVDRAAGDSRPGCR